jgi:hypothetical protein
VETAGLFLARHPTLTALFFASLIGAAGYQTFKAGSTYQRLRCAVSAADRIASEAMGG